MKEKCACIRTLLPGPDSTPGTYSIRWKDSQQMAASRSAVTICSVITASYERTYYQYSSDPFQIIYTCS